MITFNYYCLNSDCSIKGLIKIVKPRSEENKKEKCENCGEVLKLVGESPDGGFAKIASMDSNQRGAYFDKRAKDYVKKKGNDEKHQKLKPFRDVK